MLRSVMAILLAFLMLSACAPQIPGEPVSKAEYDQLKPGMTYDEIVTVIGGHPHDPAVGRRPVASTTAILHAPAEFGGAVSFIMMDGKLREPMHIPPTQDPPGVMMILISVIPMLFGVIATAIFYYKRMWPDPERKQVRLWKRLSIGSWVIGLTLFITGLAIS